METERVLGQGSLSGLEALRNFVEGLKVAESSARQLALVREQAQWLLVAARLEEIRALALSLAQARHRRLEHRWIS